MKKNSNIRDVVYIHLNEKQQYVLLHGVEFFEFASSLSDTLNHLLLLKHQFDDSDFNMHTKLDYVPKKKVMKIARDEVYRYSDFCWIDFEEMDGLNELPGQALAELLYLGHTKKHLKPPFYSYLGNRYVYLTRDDGWYNKIYFRDLTDFYRLISHVISLKLNASKLEKGFFKIKRKRNYPRVDTSLILSLKPLMKEGMVISLKEMTKSRLNSELPIWLIGDFSNMDDMYEEYEKSVKHRPCEAKLVFDKKTKEWKVRSGS